MQIVVCDTRLAVVRNLRNTLGTLIDQFPKHFSVHIHHGRVEDWDEPGVCYVNGGNTVGDMRGALDAVIERLMPGVGDDVRAMATEHGTRDRDGRPILPLFSAMLSRVNDRWLITAPCTHVAGPKNFRGTRNSFHSTRIALSMLISARRAGMDISKVVMSGMCTGHGRLSRKEAAAQMTDAFRAVFMDDNMAIDPKQAAHPRLMMVPDYEWQPK